jgi:hypothetical protein
MSVGFFTIITEHGPVCDPVPPPLAALGITEWPKRFRSLTKAQQWLAEKHGYVELIPSRKADGFPVAWYGANRDRVAVALIAYVGSLQGFNGEPFDPTTLDETERTMH